MIYRSKNRVLLRPKQHDGQKPAEAAELGFGTRPTYSGQRLVRQDGTFNVRRIGERQNFFNNSFHSLVTMRWSKFFLMLFIVFIATNLVFAILYYLLGVEHLHGMIGDTFFDQFSEAFFFSTQTLTTLGYGRISPVGFSTSLVAAIESMLGLLSFAMATGLLYGRFSHPDANIIYSKTAVVAPYKGGRGVMVRLANGRRNQLIELEALMILSRNELSESGGLSRKFYTLPLELQRVSVLASSWTIVHPISEASPLFGYTREEIIAGDSEVMVQIKAYDETYSQTVYSRSSYVHNEIIYGAKFVSAISTDDDGTSVLDLEKIDAFDLIDLPPIEVAAPEFTSKNF